MMENKAKIVHNMNSSLAALEQALILLDEHHATDPQLVDKILPLSRQKMEEILSLWGLIKDQWGKA